MSWFRSRVFCSSRNSRLRNFSRRPTAGNFGNTLEASSGVGTWNPAPTQALINAVANAGFNTVRVPCAWDSNADHSTNQINSTYMAQVKQVVDWCYAKNLTVNHQLPLGRPLVGQHSRERLQFIGEREDELLLDPNRQHLQNLR